MLDELYNKLFAITESIKPINEQEDEEDDDDLEKEEEEFEEEKEDEIGEEDENPDAEPEEEMTVDDEESAEEDFEAAEGSEGIDEPELGGGAPNAEETGTEPEAESEEDSKEAQIEKQYLGKNDDTYYYLNKIEGGWNVTDAEGKIVYPIKGQRPEVPENDVVGFIIQAQRDLELEEISGDIFKRYFEPALEEEQKVRDEEAGIEYEREEDEEGGEEEIDLKDEPPLADEFGMEEEKPMTIESKKPVIVGEDDDESEEKTFPSEGPKRTPHPAQARFGAKVSNLSKRQIGQRREVFGESKSFSSPSSGTGSDSSGPALNGTPDDVEGVKKLAVIAQKKLKDSGALIHDVHSGGLKSDSIYIEYQYPNRRVGTLRVSNHPAGRLRKFNTGDIENETELNDFILKQLSFNTYASHKDSDVKETKSINESVSELIHEVPGIDEIDQMVLEWAIGEGVIPNKFPEPIAMVMELDEVIDDEKDGEEVDALIDAMHEGGNYSESVMLLQIYYLKKILLPKAHDAYAGRKRVKESFESTRSKIQDKIQDAENKTIRILYKKYINEEGFDGDEMDMAEALDKFVSKCDAFDLDRLAEDFGIEVKEGIEERFEEAKSLYCKNCDHIISKRAYDKYGGLCGGCYSEKGEEDKPMKCKKCGREIKNERGKDGYCDSCGKDEGVDESKARYDKKKGWSKIPTAKQAFPGAVDIEKELKKGKTGKDIKKKMEKNESKMNEVKFIFDRHNFNVELTEDNENGITINVNDKQKFNFTPHFANLYRDEKGQISEDSLVELAKSALSNLSKEYFEELAKGAVEQGVEDEENIKGPEEPEPNIEDELVEESKDMKKKVNESWHNSLVKLQLVNLLQELENIQEEGDYQDVEAFLDDVKTVLEYTLETMGTPKKRRGAENIRKNESIIPDDSDSEEKKIEKLTEKETDKQDAVFDMMSKHFSK